MIMSRRISSDFDKLNLFFSNYKLTDYLSNKKQLDECKTMHKKLYGYMVFVAELIQQTGNSKYGNYLNEVASDLLLSMFNWLQGMYKPAKLELRCSIENFLKALQSIDNPEILKEKHVYSIFEQAKEDKHFISSYSSSLLQLFKNDYSFLCRTAHSDPQNICSMSAMIFLPRYDNQSSHEIVSLFTRILENSMGILYAFYPEIVDKMHPENKKDFLDCLSKSTKEAVIKQLYS